MLGIITILLLLCSLNIKANTFYVAPADPEITTEGDGSYDNPWRGLQDVINNKVETWESKNSPYDGELKIKNEGAPIKSGDTIILKDGFYGKFQLYKTFNEDYITIKAENQHQAVFSHIKIMAASHWNIYDLNINREIKIPESEQNSETNKLIFIANGWHGPAKYINIEGCKLYTVEDSSSWGLEEWNNIARNGILCHSDYITIHNNHIKNINYGIVIQRGSNSTVSNNLIENISADAMQGIGDNLLFENNIAKNFHQVDDNHLDGFQSWIDPPTDPVNGNPSDRGIVRGNIIIEHENPDHPFRPDALQGIGLYDGPYNDWIIENNIVIVTHVHGIALQGGRNCRIVNNTVISPKPEGNTHIMITDTKGGQPSENIIVRNNIVKRLTLNWKNTSDSVVVDHNLIIDADDYNLMFVDPYDPINYDLHLKPGATAINTGSPELAPDIDIEGNSRPYGNGYDIGAYEYQGELDPPPAAPTNLEVE
ncbi:MAG: right-handed parallel beta-helix repeat-containing protein [Halanaerobiales bacterium]